MIALFFATRIINGETTYDKVPKLLLEQVDEILIEKGFEHLIEGDSE